MALLPNRNPSLRLVLVSIYSCLGLVTIASSAIAHNVEVSGNVAATMHLEPNHHPKAGEPALVWFALTRQGGELVPLEQCNCRLAIYREPRLPGATPLLQPTLTSIDAEHYQGIPGSKVTFPQSGAYLMALSGTPKAGASFQAFELTYPVTVTAGHSRPAAKVSSEQPTTGAITSFSEPSADSTIPVWQIGAIVVSSLVIGLWLGAILLKGWQRK